MSNTPLVKPANCKCLYPKVVLRNGNGHDEKCPAYAERYAEWLEKIYVAPKRNEVKVKASGGNHLFLYHVKEHMLEIHRRGEVYRIPLYDLIEFGRTSDRPVFWVVSVKIPDGSNETDDVVRQEYE